jgi:uncharacterized protein
MLSDSQIAQREAFLQKPVDGLILKELFFAGLTWLRTNQQLVNSLNVFPVPDGDTGTNMVLTLQSAYNEISSSTDANAGDMAHLLSNGALMGARGNSGVILSQILRGLARGLDHLQIIDTLTLVKALGVARDTAYKGVVRPVEGTILTVAKDVAEAAETASAQGKAGDLVSLIALVVDAADRSVEHTPELLPVLKEAGVVDSGGKGLFIILEGMLRYIDGLPLDVALAIVQPLHAMNHNNVAEMIEPGQDYEVVVDFKPKKPLELVSFYEHLEQIGTSIQLGEGDGIYRMHIHVPTDKRYEPIDYVMQLGSITKVAMENLMAQIALATDPCDEIQPTFTPVEPGQIAVVVISPGVGITRVFASLGAASVVEGGQTMNPSTQEILHAFEDLPTEKIIILPNNKNIIMSAKIAAGLSVKKVSVIPSRSIPQGLSAMLRLAPNGDLDAIVEEMNEALNEVETGEITTATRNVEIDGVEVAEGQIIAMHNGKLVASSESIEDAVLQLLEEIHTSDYELITLFYGRNITRLEVDHIVEHIKSHYPEQEVEIQEGCQPHYQLIISIE